MMVWQLLQVRLIRDRPLIFVGPMWRDLRSWIEGEVVAHGLASPGDLDAVHWVDSIEEALSLVETAHQEFLRRHEVILPPVMDDRPANHPAISPVNPPKPGHGLCSLGLGGPLRGVF